MLLRCLVLAAVTVVAVGCSSVQTVRVQPDNLYVGPGLRPGHMPGAFNVPSSELVENGRLVSPERIAAAFKKAGVDTDRPIITSCGSGVTAVILSLGLDAIG